MLKKISFVLIISTLLLRSFSQPVLAAEKTTIAVYKLKANNVSERLTDALSDAMRTAISQTGKYQMLTSEDMEPLLNNIADKQKIQDCAAPACLLEIAGALGVEQLITGSVGQLENAYIINLRLFDTQLADTKNIINDSCFGKQEVLIARIKAAGLKLLAIAPAAPSLIQHEDLGEMIFVEGGTYQMGNTFGDGGADEKPVHEVTVSDFYIDKYEVTQKEYQKVMGENPSYFKDCADCPVESVTWSNARDYCAKTGKRLPTEAEWEYAARSRGKKGMYASASDNLWEYTWYVTNSGGKTHPVGQKKPNSLGIYDMSGNVYEWCSDWYDDKYYAQSPKSNPGGPARGIYKVHRGGSWDHNGYCARSASRLRGTLDSRYYTLGFRCARTK